MKNAMRIDKCVCTDKTFEQLVAEARAFGLSLDDLGACYGVGEACGLCKPYLRRALVTGETAFCQILVDPDASKSDRHAG